MLNVYLSVDIEGINGVVYPHQTVSSGGESYIQAANQQMAEVNTIIDALIKADVDKITVNDAHGTMENLNLAKINPNVELITGKPKTVSMLAGLDSSYSCAFFVGYHAKAGSEEGVLAHTFSDIFNKVILNGDLVGEIELNAIWAGRISVPVALVTGDNAACDEAVSVIGDVNTVVTKRALSTTAAICRPNEQLFEELNSKVRNTIRNQQDWIIYKKNPPYTLEIEFKDRKKADVASLMPNIERISPTMIRYESEFYQEVYKTLQFFSATMS